MSYLNPKNTASLLLLLGPPISITAHAEIYMSADQAAQIFFPNQIFKKKSVALTNDEKNKIEILTKNSVKSNHLDLLMSQQSNVVIVDQVIGKHELITYAIGLTKEGKIQGIEIMEYRESYGHQVRREAWRKQFTGKDVSAPLQLNKDIKNLSGATLSSSHITDGVRRVLQTYEQIKSKL